MIMNELDFLKFVIEGLVEKKENVVVESITDELGILLTVKVDSADMWFVIWKAWNTITAIRNIMRVYWAKNNKRINVKVLD